MTLSQSALNELLEAIRAGDGCRGQTRRDVDGVAHGRRVDLGVARLAAAVER